MAILSFGDSATADLFHGTPTRKSRQLPPDIIKTALRKLDMLNAAQELTDLRVPPGNRLKPLEGNLKGFYSIRINDQWRIIFRWQSGAVDVAIDDYH